MAPPFAFPFNVTGAILSETVTYRDAKGNTSTMRFYVNAFAGADPTTNASAFFSVFIPKVTALTWAAFQRAHGPFDEYGPAQFGAHNTGGAYESVIEKMQVVCQNPSGKLLRFQVPAPKVANFAADKITMDPSVTAVATFITAVETPDANGCFLCDREGFALQVMGGIFVSRKIRRKTGILTLTPALTPTEPPE